MNRLKPFYSIGNLREMSVQKCALHTLGVPVNRASTKQLLNNFLGQLFRKAYTIFGARVKNGLFI